MFHNRIFCSATYNLLNHYIKNSEWALSNVSFQLRSNKTFCSETSRFSIVGWSINNPESTIYTMILLKSVGVSKLQVAIIARSSRVMFQTVRIDWKHILSRVRVSVRPSNCFIREKHPKLSRIPSRPRQCLFEWSSDLPLFDGHGRSIASDKVGAYMSGDNSDHIGPSAVRLSQNGEMQQVKTATTRYYTMK